MLMLILICVCFFSGAAWAPDDSNDRGIGIESFLHNYNTIPLVKWDNLDDIIYCYTTLELIDGDWVAIEKCITLELLKEMHYN